MIQRENLLYGCDTKTQLCIHKHTREHIGGKIHKELTKVCRLLPLGQPGLFEDAFRLTRSFLTALFYVIHDPL